MRTRLPRHLLIALSAAALASCIIQDGEVVVPGLTRVEGSGTVVQRDYDLDGFDRVALTGVGRVLITPGGDHRVLVETDDNILDVLVVEVRGGTLQLAVESGTSIDPSILEFTIELPELAGVELPGAGDVVVTGWIGEGGEISLPGAGKVDATGLELDRLEVDISGVGSVVATGTARDLRLALPGAGSFEGAQLEAARVEADLSGVGSAEVWATEDLDVSVSGAGSLRYRGDPAVIRSDISGVGSIEPLDR